MFLGISATIREENAAYLKSWCKTIKEDPKFILTVLTDAMKATKFISDKLGLQLDEEKEIKEVA